MGVIQGVRQYYSLFGSRGLFLVTKARLRQRPIEIRFTVPGLRHPIYLRLRTSDVSLFAGVLLNSEYEFPRPVRAPATIVDAGANIGLASVFYANRYPETKIISVEPERSNFEMLKKNTELYPNIVPVQAALWNENAQLTIFDPGLDHEGFRIGGRQECAASETRGIVAGVTVDKLMDDFSLDQIDLLKIDIEGSEKEVFESSSSWIDRVGMIAIELHDRFKAGCVQSVHSAARAFEFDWSVGETTFFVRKEYAGSVDSSEVYINQIRCELPLEIDWAGYDAGN